MGRRLTAIIRFSRFSPQIPKEEYAVMSLRYDWPPKRGTSVGLAIGYHLQESDY